MLREPIEEPKPIPAPLDEILSEFAFRGIRPTRLNVLAAALDAGHAPDFAVALADAAARMEEADAGKTERLGGGASQGAGRPVAA